MFSFRSSLASLVVAAVLLQPVTAFAAFTTPSELFQRLIQSGNSPTSHTLQFMGTFDGASVKLSVYGAEEEVLTLSKAKARYAANLDVESENFSLHANLQAILYKKVAYVRFTELAGHGEQWASLEKSGAAKFMGQWIAIPLTISDEEYASIVEGEDGSLDTDYGNIEMLDEFFTLHHERFRSGHAYTLTLRPDLAEYIITNFGVADVDADQLRSALGHLSFRWKIDTNNKDIFQYSSLEISYMNDGEPKGSFTLSATSQRQMTPVYVDVPKKTIPWSEVEAALNASPTSMPTFDTNEDSHTSVQEQELQPEKVMQISPKAEPRDVDFSLLPIADIDLPVIDLVGPSGRRHIRVPVQFGTSNANLMNIVEDTAVLYVESSPHVIEFSGPIQDPLEVLFFDTQGKFLASSLLESCSNACTTVSSPRTTKYTLETLPGFTQKYGIRLGWRMMLYDGGTSFVPAATVKEVNRIRLRGAHELNLADQPSKYDGDDLVVAPENQRLVTLGKIVATQIRVGDLRSLIGKDRGARAEFMAISEQLRVIKAKNLWLKDLFIVRATGAPGVVEIVVDPDLIRIKNIIAAGQDTWEISDITEHSDRAVSFSLRDEAGKKHTYVYIPIFDNNGVVVGGVVLE